MLTAQDQKVMHQYFTDMLFRPLAEDIEVAAEVEEEKPAIVKNIQPKNSHAATPLREDPCVKSTVIELLPLPTTQHENEKTKTNDTQNLKENSTGKVESEPPVSPELQTEKTSKQDAVENNPWVNYHWENQQPPWAQESFDCLLFEVCGFNFAVPLITLGQIHMVSSDLSPVFGQATWFMGIQSTPMGKLRVINTAQFVMPERYQPEANYQPAYMISIANCLWALAVDKVNQPIKLKPSDVKWRAQRQRQSWLAGVVKQQMCALIDIPALAGSLIARDRNHGDTK